MEVTVRARGTLRRFRPDGSETFTVALPAGATVRDLIEASGIPWAKVLLVTVNGVQARDETALSHGDQVIFLAPMAGG